MSPLHARFVHKFWDMCVQAMLEIVMSYCSECSIYLRTVPAVIILRTMWIAVFACKACRANFLAIFVVQKCTAFFVL